MLTNRQSVVSLTSSASLAEQDPTHHRRGKRRSLKPSTRSRTCLQVDEARDARRKKIISEFYDTEKSYVDGLDLVYSVDMFAPPMIDLLIVFGFSTF